MEISAKDVFFVCAGIAMIILAIAVPVTYYNVAVETTAMKEGYEQVKPTSYGPTMWVKKGSKEADN
jgi:hypothetical protein